MSVDVILGLQWGDEGKGKIVDLLAPNYDIVARFQGGPNAGHTINFDNIKLVLHTIPSGITNPKTTNIIGNGVIIDPVTFNKEITFLEKININAINNLKISNRAHLILPSHRLIDIAQEKNKKNKKIGSTLKGIGPTYTDKISRQGIRAGEIFSSDFKETVKNLEKIHLSLIKSMGYDYSELNEKYLTDVEEWYENIDFLKKFDFIDSEIFLNNAIKKNHKILAEGAQGSLLDVDFGSYPYVTSSNTTIGGVCTGLGIPHSSISKVYGVFKAYSTRVGNGPFPTELFDESGEQLRKCGNEYGSTTGRPRRCGWIDLPLLRYTTMINGVTDLIITKSDVLESFDKINACVEYEYENKKVKYTPFNYDENKLKPVLESFNIWDESIKNIKKYENLPINFKKYINFIEKYLDKIVFIVSTGPDRNDSILCKK